MKKVRDWNVKDFITYTNNRVCDGNWSGMMAATCVCVRADMPKVFGKNKWFRKLLLDNEIFNIVDFPDLIIDIDTGKVIQFKEGEDKDE